MRAPSRWRLATHVAAFAAGVITAVAFASEARESDERYQTLDTFAHSLSLIRRHHVDSVSERALVYGAIDGMVAVLDEHSDFYPPQRYQRLREDTQGVYGGVGVVLRRAPASADPPYPIVEDVISGSPSARAGIVVGSELLEIDGSPTANAGDTKRRARAFDSVLRGPAGSKVKIKVRSAGKARDLELVREKVKVPSIEAWSFGDQIVYAHIRRFQEATTVDLAAALKTLGAASARGLVLDLRGNPGGLFDQALAVADLFLDGGVIVQVIGRGERVLERPEASPGGAFEKVRLAILVDGNTASAAEILAGALRDHHRGELFGLNTFGKGSVQTFYDLPGAAGLKLTTARYVSPSGTVIHGTGILPQHVVDAFSGDTFVVGGDEGSAGGADEDPWEALRRQWPHLSAELAERLDADKQLFEAYSFLREGGGK